MNVKRSCSGSDLHYHPADEQHQVLPSCLLVAAELFDKWNGAQEADERAPTPSVKDLSIIGEEA